MVRVLIITLCIVCDIWLLHQIWVAEKNMRSTSEKLLWSAMILFFHVVTVAIYIFLDTTNTNNKDKDDENTTIYM
ncbi:MAG: hypothetical protein MJ198_06635 [Bacteroidales bacterium]|nr:hypothetical protein [Bacteroidales bacterium]